MQTTKRFHFNNIIRSEIKVEKKWKRKKNHFQKKNNNEDCCVDSSRNKKKTILTNALQVIYIMATYAIFIGRCVYISFICYRHTAEKNNNEINKKNNERKKKKLKKCKRTTKKNPTTKYGRRVFVAQFIVRVYLFACLVALACVFVRCFFFLFYLYNYLCAYVVFVELRLHAYSVIKAKRRK